MFCIPDNSFRDVIIVGIAYLNKNGKKISTGKTFIDYKIPEDYVS